MCMVLVVSEEDAKTLNVGREVCKVVRKQFKYLQSVKKSLSHFLQDRIRAVHQKCGPITLTDKQKGLKRHVRCNEIP